jgi:Uma2 family endonuclease
MSTAIQLLTAEDLERLPRDGQRHELVRGEVLTMPPAGFEHGAIGINLSTPLDQHVKANHLGRVVGAETGFLLAQNPDTVRGPDIGFVRQDRVEAVGMPRSYWPGAPDAAAEIVSPGDTVFEVDAKVQEWLAAGTSLVWVINPRQRMVTVYRPGANPVILRVGDTLDGQEVIPGFRIPVASLFV